jgi:hypothetical protein
MAHSGPALEAGTRCRLTELGRQRSPKLAAKIGTILRQSRNSRQYYVLWDGNITPVTLHCTYIEPASSKNRIRRPRSKTTANTDLRELPQAG